MEKIIILGAGNTGRKALETLIRQGSYRCAGFVDDTVPPGTLVQGVPVIGPLDRLSGSAVRNAFIAIGNNCQRKSLADKLVKEGYNLISLIDPSAFISCEARIGTGVLIMPHCYVGHNASIGNLSICQASSVISHYATLGEASNMGYSCVISAYAHVGALSRIGIGAKVLNRVHISEACLIGAGAIVTKNVPPGKMAYGVPAKIIRDVDLTSFNPNKEVAAE